MHTENGTLHNLLVELQTEELPPKALQSMSEAFSAGLHKVLADHQLSTELSRVSSYATPRRLATIITAVRGQAEDQPFAEKLMPVKIAFTESGAPSEALLKRLEAKGLGHLSADQLHVESDGKQDFVFAKGLATGATLEQGLQEALDYTITHLPIPKVMRYQLADGVTSVRFVRPAHGLVALWGTSVIEVQALGLQGSNESTGHRFMGSKQLTIQSPESYVQQLAEEGKVIASFSERKALIQKQLDAACHRLKANLGTDPEVAELLDEVTALVEHPTVYVGEFDPKFLSVPAECLILTMRLNQRYFPLFDPDTQQLTNKFLLVSNMELDDPSTIIQGNERVILPRLADAEFFFDTDRKRALADRVEDLEASVYHNKLGSQRVRTDRLRHVARFIATQLGANVELADRAALLAKADLNTLMVGEFPELQGVIGAYYARADHEDPAVVNALHHQYQHRLTEPVHSDTLVAAILFLAERVETLVGIWGIGLAPTGERDPYALRRAALGVISAYEQLQAGQYLGDLTADTLNVRQLLEEASKGFAPEVLADNTVEEVHNFIYERLRNQLVTQWDRSVVDAVLAVQPPLQQVSARIQACTAFAALPEADSLAAANKRVTNILRKAEYVPAQVDQSLLTENAEVELAECLAELAPIAQTQFQQGNFTASLATLAAARAPVDNFFNEVMVMAEDERIRHNRLALLKQLHQLMNQVADLSRLAQ